MPVYTNQAIDRIREDFSGEELANLQLYRDYAEGRQNRMMTPGQRRLLYPQKMNPQADNILRLVLNTITSRLVFQGWEVKEPEPEVGDDEEDLEEDLEAVGPVQGYLNDVYMRNRLQRLQYDVHYSMLRDGNHAVSTAWKDGRPRVFRERWWDGEEGIFIGYDRSGDKEFAVKEWKELDEDGKATERRTVYYPDHFIRFYKDGSGWAPIRQAAGTFEEEMMERAELRSFPDGSVAWEKAPGDPLGLPVVHFANGSRDDTPYGASDLVGLLGLQDEINSMQHDTSAASKFTGFQQVWAKSAGGGTKLVIGPGRLLEFPPDTQGTPAGVLPPGDLTALTSGVDHKRSTVATISQTPLHQITGKQWPSGEAILQVQMPTIDKATRLISIVGPEWGETGHRITELENTFGDGGLDEDAPITAVMENPRRLDELTEVRIQAERAKMLETISRIGDKVLLRMIPELSEAQIRELLANREGLTWEEGADTEETDDETTEDEATMAGAEL